MDKAFWDQAWQIKRLNAYQPMTHPLLMSFWPRVQAQPQTWVFVPFCGSSQDMRWLAAQGFRVLGVDVSELAQQDFVAKDPHNTVNYLYEDGFKIAYQQQISFYCGDFFHLHTKHLQGINSVYDAAALAALPEARRQRYSVHLAHLLKPGTRMLMLAHEFTQKRITPPFSVEGSEMQRLFGCNFHIECLYQGSTGKTGHREMVYLLTRKGCQI
ncbi:thiopurine S-methyltransferase [Allopseudospirillum japonicum]|uniref:thiopurine S-methyltransferase n=1 Tax=Allopseudospirillum japonicum TaxID=64971 RepID=A0A1H6Q742_9GAMM|nr:thiopurine S-methyltransferase [Allopseudospirillum japonicum]SEI39619.1 thiopurine S-methyltransferase [Allopseudospirillum japonicum]